MVKINFELKHIKSKLILKGKSIQWLVDEMGIPRSSFYRKATLGTLSKSEKFYIKHLLECELEELKKIEG